MNLMHADTSPVLPNQGLTPQEGGLHVIERSVLHSNASRALLVELSLLRNEARITADGALVVSTGEHTGRSPKDKFIVRDEGTEGAVWWANTGAIDPPAFERLLEDMGAYAAGRSLFRQDLFAAANPTSRIGVRVITEHAWHALFITNMLLRPKSGELADFSQDLTIIDFPGFKADPKRHGCRSDTVIACDFARGVVLIGGTQYAGEIKKAVFTYLNYILPVDGFMPMHCAANIGQMGDAALFFGLSGTGKTTLSADPHRKLIGDDEHGWGPDGIFNFEGGCYAKTIRLSESSEPEIHAATRRFGTVLENVIIDKATRLPDFDDSSLTENTRAAYPIETIANVNLSGQGPHPLNIIMLSCDAFGVLPPIAKLTSENAIRFFLAGYTAKVAGTERGITEPQATFSPCFGAPFMPRPPQVYGNLLGDLIARHKVKCWLVNTGWTGGPPGQGQRMPLAVTRRLINAVLDGIISDDNLQIEPHFGLSIPKSLPEVDPSLLDPARAWSNFPHYAEAAKSLRHMFDDAIQRL